MGRRTAPNARTDAPVAAPGVRRGNVSRPWEPARARGPGTRAHASVSEPEGCALRSGAGRATWPSFFTPWKRTGGSSMRLP